MQCAPRYFRIPMNIPIVILPYCCMLKMVGLVTLMCATRAVDQVNKVINSNSFTTEPLALNALVNHRRDSVRFIDFKYHKSMYFKLTVLSALRVRI